MIEEPLAIGARVQDVMGRVWSRGPDALWHRGELSRPWATLAWEVGPLTRVTASSQDDAPKKD